MEKEEREKKLRSLRANRETFLIAAPNGKYKGLKKLGRKMTFWYTQPFGEAQNRFNDAAFELISDIHDTVSGQEDRLSMLETQIERRVFAFTQEQRQILARNQAAWHEALDTLAGQIDESLCGVAPECRRETGTPTLTQIPQVASDKLHKELLNVQNSHSDEEVWNTLDVLSARYGELLREQLRFRRDAETAKPVVLVCRSFGSGAGMEAVRNEVWDLCALMQRASRYPCMILSIEPQGAKGGVRGNVHFVAENELASWLRLHDPALLVFCESNSAILAAGGGCLMLRNAMVRLSGQNPAEALGGSRMQELLHLCDSGVQHYFTASQGAADTMEQLGFRRPVVLYPYIDTDKPVFSRRPRAFDPAHMVVGFAASPLEKRQNDARGIPALCEVVRDNPDMNFIVLWRDSKAVSAPAALKDAPNCEIRYGRCDMAEFYSEVDCVLVPFAGRDYNHACPLSALEGMLMGIPTVCTPEAGIAELVNACGLGMVAENHHGKAISAALRKIPGLYSAFLEPWRSEKLRRMVSGRNFVLYAEQCIREAPSAGVLSLYEWDRQLKAENKHLTRGAAALRAYYQRQGLNTENIPEPYPQNCFDAMEQQSVAILLEDALRGKEEPTLLDAACGEGRILKMLLPFGKCTAADISPAALSLVQARYPDVQAECIDLFTNEPGGIYDAVTVFRLLRHYEYGDRRKLWARLRAELSSDGVLLFDAPNMNFELPNRQKNGWGKFPLYDTFWTRRSIEKELRDNGLQLAAIIPVGAGLYPVSSELIAEPMTFTVMARRI